MRSPRPLAAAALAVAIAAGLLALPSAIAGAANGPALPPSKYGGSCAGDTPVVVASDAGAQSDIYSAVTLAGVLDTDCVVLAGPRGADMPAAQARRLEAAADGGYIVGGAAAVPDCKLAGRKMARLAGADRWTTAEAVGAEAKRIADGNPSTPRAIPDRACDFEPPPDPQPTGYKAIDAGSFHSCAVRTSGELTCWGVHYREVEVRGGVRSDVQPVVAPGGSFKAVAAGSDFSCAVRTSGELTCWSNNDGGLSNVLPDAPSGSFKALDAGFGYACAIRTSGELTCWGSYTRYGVTDAPGGSFKAVAAGSQYACAIRTGGELTCWGRPLRREPWEKQINAPSGSFKAVAVGGGHACAIRTNGKAICWGYNEDGQADAPAGSFKAIAAGGGHSCAIRTNGKAICWGDNEDGQADAPAGSFKAIAANWRHACAIRTNGTLSCWGENGDGQANAPS